VNPHYQKSTISLPSWLRRDKLFGLTHPACQFAGMLPAQHRSWWSVEQWKRHVLSRVSTPHDNPAWIVPLKTFCHIHVSLIVGK